jgi:hypothetical protein
MDHPQEGQPAMSTKATAARARHTAAADGDPLADLRARIAGVTRRRRRQRLLSGLSRLALAILIATGVLFLLDWLFAPGRLVRGLALCVTAVAVARVYWRRVRPGLVRRETAIDIALAIEKEQGIDSDLVAALEFADGHSGSESDDLRSAVIDYVADFGRSWQMPRGAIDPKLRRRAAWLAAALAGIVIAAALRPDFAAAFLNRLFLGSARYPTRTRIESLAIGGTSIDQTPAARAEVKIPLGRAVGFTVGVGGELPRLVKVRLQSVLTGKTSEIELLPEVAGALDPKSSPATVASGASFATQLPKFTESVDAQVFAGDAWTDPVRVTGIAAPLIDLALTATPPAYARGGSDRPATGARQVTVLEGSGVGIAVRCTNKKLASAMLLVDGVEHRLRPHQAAAGGLAADWEIAAAESPLARLDQTVTFELRVVDEDGLDTELPIVGSIRVKPDAAPRVTADVQTRLVLPTAAPRLAWRVTDDHAVASVVVVAEAVATGAEIESPGGEQRPRSITIPVPLPADAAGWVGRERLPLEGSVAVALDPLGLVAGDQVRLTVRAADYRGAAAGREAESEPIVLDVTDERGILAALTETDERSVEQLDAIIDRELTVGGAK